MADRWEDEREWRERDAEFSRGYPGEDQREVRDGYRGGEARSFRDRGPRGAVFGERETGADYGDSRQAGGGYGGGQAGYGSPIRGADRSYPRQPRWDDRADRERAYRAAYGDDPVEDDPVEQVREHRHRDDHRAGFGSGYGPDRGERDRYYHDNAERWGRNVDPGEGRHQRNFLDRAADSVASWFSGERREFEAPRRDAPHRGLGPQGYTRSDERITDEVHERLTEDAWLDASHIGIAVSSGEVTLSGTVTERAAKHRAEHIVEDIAGVKHVQNNLRVDHGFGAGAPIQRKTDS